MRKAETTGSTYDRSQQPRLHGLVNRRHEFRGWLRCDAAHDVDPEFRSNNSGVGQHLAHIRAQVADPPRNHRPDARWDGQAQAGQVADVTESTLRLQESDRLADEQRISVRLAPHCGGRQAIGSDVGRRAHVFADGVRVEPAEHHQPGRPLARHLRDGQSQWVIGRQFQISIGPKDQHGHLAELGGDESQEQDRRCIGGVKVVEDDERRLRGRDVVHERRRGVKQLEPRGLRVGVRRAR